MKHNLKRALSWFLSLSMVLTQMLAPGLIAFAADVALTFGGATVEASDADQTVELTLSATSAFNCATTGGTISVDSPLEVTGLKGHNDASIMEEYNDGVWTTFMDPSGMEDVDITKIVTIVVKVPGGTPAGSYNVTITDLILGYNYGQDSHNYADTQTAAITVTDGSGPVVEPGTYELYYTLNSSTDTDGDKYIEYNPGDTVTATVYLKAAADDTLQAFDLYVTNDANLTYTSYTSDYGTRIAGTSTAISQQIQAVGASKESPINVDLPADTGVAIATLTFTVADTAVYNTGLPITIQTASNIAVANTPDSFTPTVGGDVLGAETLKTYTVSYDDNVTDETITVPASQTKQHNVALTLSATVPSREGYTFQGWTKTSGGTTVDYEAGASFAENADTTLYAVWQANTHSVTWKSQDGATTLETDTDVAFGTTLSYNGTEPSKAVDAQYTYTFAGWSTSMNAETGAAASDLTMGDADMVLYAAFSKVTNKYTVIFYDEDGTTVLKEATQYDYNTPAEDIVQPETPTKPADETYTYSFAGWSPDLTDVTKNQDYKATYTPSYIDYAITYSLGDHPADGQTAPTSPATAHYNVQINLPAAVTPATGYAFIGWSDGENTYAAGAPYTVKGTTTLTAQYSENSYTIHYDGNSNTAGTVPSDLTGIAYSSTSVALASQGDLLRSGYSFQGWNTAADGSGTDFSGTVAMSALEPFAVDGIVTLYAKWGTEAYTITYDYDGGALPMTDPVSTNPSGYDVDSLPITLIRPTLTGYEFTSWTIEVKSGESGNVVVDGDQIKAGTWGNLTVKANWTEAETSYTVKHYQQNIDNDDYTEVTGDAETKTGITGTTTAATAKTYTGFTAKTITQKTIAADGSTVVEVYYDRNIYTVTYSYTGDVPSGENAPIDENSPYRYGATVTVKNAPTTPAGYTFGGWSKTGSFVIDDNTTITGAWSLNTYYITFYKDDGTTVVDKIGFTAETTSISAPTVPAKTENVDWYDAGEWGPYDVNVLKDQEVTPIYDKLTFTITFQDEGGTDLDDQGTDPNFDIDDDTITPPEVPDKPGYTGTWPIDTTVPGNVTIKPVYTADEYTITFVTDGGTAIGPMTYTIESEAMLPSATGKTNYTFLNWKVTTEGGNWAADSEINGGTAVTGKYGDVTLTAQWEVGLTYELEEYKYAPTGYKLLIIDAAGAGSGNVYKYNNDVMYYTTDANYMITKNDSPSTAVFFTLVEEASFTVDKIAATAGEQATITYDGDVNGDGTVNIADANAVFQMVVATGSYYSLDQLSIAQRLAADMVTATANAEHRGSIEDVNAIVAIINGTN